MSFKMDIDEELILKKCIQLDQSTMDVLNIDYNPSNSMIILWNKFEIYVYEKFNFSSVTKVLMPDYQIHRLIITNNYLFCLDQAGNVHVTSLKFKNSLQAKLKCTFQPKEGCIQTFCLLNEESILSLKFEHETYFLCTNKINPNFDSIKKVLILSKTELDKTKNKSFLYNFNCNKEQIEALIKAFDIKYESNDSEMDLIIVSFDMRTLYGCVYNSKIEEEVTLVQLYSCPSEIKKVKIIFSGDLYLYIALDIGSIVKLNLNDMDTPAYIIHLNMAIHRIEILNEALIYTDGSSLWEMNIRNENFKDLSVNNVHDLKLCYNMIICTTFSRLIYCLPYSNDIRIVKEEYCQAEEVVSNSECLEQIFEQIETNKVLLKKAKKEENYIMAMSLSNRQDLMETVIDSKVTVYESYNEILKENSEIKVLETLKEYFVPNIQILLIKINVKNTNQKIRELLDNLELNCHLTLIERNKILKIINFKLKSLEKCNFTVPIKMDATELTVNIKIVSIIPGSLNENKKIYNIIYRKNIILNSEHFIRAEKKNNVLSNETDNPEVLITKLCQNNIKQYGDLFNINKIENESQIIPFYVKLPPSYEDVFIYKQFLSSLNVFKTKFLFEQFNLVEFLKSKSPLTLEVVNEKVKIEVFNDGFSSPVLKVTSDSNLTALNIRNFLASIIYNYRNYEGRRESIHSSFYATTENLQKAVKYAIAESDFEEFSAIIEQYEKNVVGLLPL